MQKKDLLPILQRQYEVGATANHQLVQRCGFVVSGLIVLSTIWWRLETAMVQSPGFSIGAISWAAIVFRGTASLLAMLVSFVYLVWALYPRGWAYPDLNIPSRVKSIVEQKGEVSETETNGLLTDFASAVSTNRATNDRRYGHLQSCIRWLLIGCGAIAVQAGWQLWDTYQASLLNASPGAAIPKKP